MKRIIKNLALVFSVVLCKVAFAQEYIPYYPADWEFKSEVDLVNFSAVKSVTSNDFIVDENKEVPFSTTSLNWNSTYQLTAYGFVNHQMKESSFNVQMNYETPNGNQLKSVKILNPNTRKTVEERNYSNGSFDVEKITVKRYLLNVAEPDVFEVKYEGNDDDFIQEVIYTPQNKIERLTKNWQHRTNDGGYQSVKKIYLDNMLDQTDSLVVDARGKKKELHLINFGKANKMLYHYKKRKIKVYGEEQDYEELERIQKDGKDNLRYEYEYDTKDNWKVRRTYKIKNGKWQLEMVTRREIEYR